MIKNSRAHGLPGGNSWGTKVEVHLKTRDLSEKQRWVSTRVLALGLHEATGPTCPAGKEVRAENRNISDKKHNYIKNIYC